MIHGRHPVRYDAIQACLDLVAADPKLGKLIERIGDHAQRIASTYAALNSGKPLDPRIVKEIEEARVSAVHLLDTAFTALLTRDIDAANQAIDGRVAHQTMVEALAHRVSSRRGEELLALGNVVDSLGRAAAYTSEIAEQGIDIAVMTDPEAT